MYQQREGRRKVISYPLTDQQGIRDHLVKLKNLVSRLQSLQLDYQELAKTAQLNIQNAETLACDINAFTSSLGVAPIPVLTIELFKREAIGEPGFYIRAHPQAEAVAR